MMQNKNFNAIPQGFRLSRLHYGLHQRKSYINQIKHPSNSMWQGSTYKKNSLNLQKIEAIEISLKKSLYSHSIVALGFGDIS